jgi:tetrahydromethanopterin S-methyltransferase subunit F
MAGGRQGAAQEPLGQWSLYWGVAVSAAAAPGMALLFAPVTTMSYRTELMVRWATLARVFALSHRIFAMMIGLALIGLLMALFGLRASRWRAARDPAAPPFSVGHAGDAFFGLLLGILNLLFWGTALYLSLLLHTIYQGWGVPLAAP